MISDIEAKQSEIITEVNCTNTMYNLNYDLDEDITCTQLIEDIKTTVVTSQGQLYTKLEKSTQATAIINAVEQACTEANNQLDGEMDKSKLQVRLKIFVLI